MKKTIERNLALHHTYILVSTNYATLESGTVHHCANCNRPIVNTATVKDTTIDQTYIVGIDCAASLQGVKGQENFKQELDKFAEATSALVWLKHKIKKHKGYIKTITLDDYEANNLYAGSITLHLTMGDEWRNCYKPGWESHTKPMVENLIKEINGISTIK